MTRLKLSIHDRERSKEAKALLNELIRFNTLFGGRDDWRELTISLKDAKGKVVAGLNGHSGRGLSGQAYPDIWNDQTNT